MRAVVFLLIGDIVDDRVFVRLAYRKSSITFLPRKITIIQIIDLAINYYCVIIAA